MIDDPAPITEHLAELRKRIFWIVLTMVVFAVAAFSYAEQIFLFLMDPAVQAIGEQGGKLQAIAPTETFFTYLKCALLAGFVLSLPVTFWQIWVFVAPGLYATERRAIVPFVVISSLLFIGGATFGYTQVFPLVFEFLSGFSSELVEQNWTMREAFSVTTRLFLAFGVAFELPVFVFFLSITGIMSARRMLSGTPYAVLAMFVVAAILTPPDFVSQVLLAIPMLILYLLGVAVAWMFEPRRRRIEAEAETDKRA
ncbi:MAG: twin-arginine translocase subunit TatC [Deltaproteobacteria bacterium]|nr:twin-arginine translocase subunit TatC [Deltaproteobacteria bacterium]MBW2382338.1 twin-arginine translocase subunit TatC [Deltaproteobacteria bacterium]MBW2696328.1 twin-arginine translocase subunit TatC [Deltaproteobacteria bacterium]